MEVCVCQSLDQHLANSDGIFSAEVRSVSDCHKQAADGLDACSYVGLAILGVGFGLRQHILETCHIARIKRREAGVKHPSEAAQSGENLLLHRYCRLVELLLKVGANALGYIGRVRRDELLSCLAGKSFLIVDVIDEAFEELLEAKHALILKFLMGFCIN